MLSCHLGSKGDEISKQNSYSQPLSCLNNATSLFKAADRSASAVTREQHSWGAAPLCAFRSELSLGEVHSSLLKD